MLTAEDLKAIRELMKEELEPIKEQLQEIDTSIGMLADWADKVADVTRTPFASGGIAMK